MDIDIDIDIEGEKDMIFIIRRKSNTICKLLSMFDNMMHLSKGLKTI